MPVSVQVIRATEAHAEAMAPRMRAEDAAEVMASGGYSPPEALLASLRGSSEAWTALFDGEPAAMFGVAPLPVAGVAAAWLLTTDLVAAHPRDFWRACHSELPKLLERYPVLVNAIDARYEAALRWAARLGFLMADPMPFGVEGRPFVPIRLEAPCASS